MSSSTLRIVAAGTLGLLILSAAAAPSLAADADAAKKSLEKLGKKIGKAGREVGDEIADAAKKVLYKGKKVSAPLLKKTQGATRDFWAELIKGKDRTISELREENKRLRRKLKEAE
jgi:hypothetical protein